MSNGKCLAFKYSPDKNYGPFIHLTSTVSTHISHPLMHLFIYRYLEG